jgi:phage/plasmid-associated DNA primase
MCCGDEALEDVLIAFLAATLTSRWDLQKFLFLHGGGGNGKSTFNELADLLIGEENTYGSRLIDFFTNKHTAAAMEGKKLVTFADEDGGHRDVGKLKSLTGHDKLESELKFKNSHQFRYEGMVIIAANSAIFNGAHQGASMSRRMIAFPCLAELTVAEQVNQIPYFTSELSAITTMLLNKSPEWVKTTLTTANQIPAIAELTKDLRAREDSVAAFIDEFVTVAADTQVGTLVTYQAMVWAPRSSKLSQPHFSPL